MTHFIVLTLLCLQDGGMEINYLTLVLVACSSFMLSMSLASVPGDGIASMLMLFGFMGIEENYLAMASMAFIFVDFFGTVLNVLGNILLVYVTAKELKLTTEK